MTIGLSVVLSTFPAHAAPLSGETNQLKSEKKLVRVIVRFKQPTLTSGLSSPLSNLSGYLALAHSTDEIVQVKTLGLPGLLTSEVSEDGLRALQADPNVLEVVEDTLSRPTLTDTIPQIGADSVELPSGLHGGEGTTIAIIDTGVDSSHPFLKNKIANEACFSTSQSSIYKIKTLCPNGQNEQIAKGAAMDCDPDISGCGHGTHVAGIAVGGPLTLEGKSIRGVAPSAKLIAAQVYTEFYEQSVCGSIPAPCALSFASDQLRALEYIFSQSTKFKIAAINMSLGNGSFSEPCINDSLASIIKKISEKQIATVVSSGNDGLIGSISSPACVPGVIAVGAVDKSNTLAYSFSNTSELITILAPGDHVTSSEEHEKFGWKSGTSMSAPHVSGALALIVEKSPNIKLAALKTFLIKGGTTVKDNRTGQSFTSLNVKKSVLLSTIQAPKPPKEITTVTADSSMLSHSTSMADSSENPKRVIVDIPSTSDLPKKDVSEITSDLESATGKNVDVKITNKRAIIEITEGINTEDKAAIKKQFGQDSTISPDTLSRPQLLK